MHSSPLTPLMSLLDSAGATAALDIAFKQGLIDRLMHEALPRETVGDPLYGLLIDANVICDSDRQVQLTDFFKEHFGDRIGDLEAIVSFAKGATMDVLTKMESLCGDLDSFMETSNTFAVFRYDKALDISETSLSETRKWVRYVEALTRFELPLLKPFVRLDNATRILEIGGNTGLFLEAILEQDDRMVGHVLDLPAVCSLGKQRIGDTSRVSFFAGDALNSDWLNLAGSHDVVAFKSMLHDWPDREAKLLLEKAVTHLKESCAPGNGCIMVVERGAWEDETGYRTAGYNLLNLVFSPFYRSPGLYVSWLEEFGFEVEISSVRIDMMFHVIKAYPRSGSVSPPKPRSHGAA